MKKWNIREIVVYGMVVGSGILFILLASSWTSPFFPGSYGYDASFFSMMGRAVLEGKVPYRDYFDLKGPAFFFLQAVGQLFIRDRGGVVLLQVVAISITGIALYKTCMVYITKLQTVFVFLVFYFVYTTCLWGGNSVEELCMPFQMVCLYLGICYLEKEENENIKGIALFFGISFAIMLFSKVTVAAPMVAVSITVFARMMHQKKYKEALQCVIYFVFGAAMVTLPILVYFITNGALKDMIFCVFQFAFKRSTDYYEGFSLKWEKNLIVCYGAFFLFLFKWKQQDSIKWLLFHMSIVIFLLLHLGTPFAYYFITTLPLLCLLCIAFLREVNTHKTDKSVKPMLFAELAILLVLFAYGNDTIQKMKDNLEIAFKETELAYYNDCIEIKDLIPESERDEIYCLESGMIFYEVNQMLPSNKYPVNLPYFMDLHPVIKKEVLHVITEETPKWVISEKFSEFDDDDVKIAVYNRYEMIASNSAEQLYRRIDE